MRDADPLARALLTLVRRYRICPVPPSSGTDRSAAASLAAIVEQARVARADKQSTGDSLRLAFRSALARLIDDAARMPGGDPAYAAVLLRHEDPQVRDYVDADAGAEAARRTVAARVNAIAHPARLARHPAGPVRDHLQHVQDALQGALAGAHWQQLADWTDPGHLTARIADPACAATPDVIGQLTALHQLPELSALRRLDTLKTLPAVQRYIALREAHHPPAGSALASARGVRARQRGEASESAAARALSRVAQALTTPTTAYRVATSLRAPGNLPGLSARAKSEWDAVLLRRVESADDVWSVCLLVEVKASPDAAASDLPRLLRGLSLLASAQPGLTYLFASHQGPVRLRADALRALPTRAESLAGAVLYCCDAPVHVPRSLTAASRMQLLSAAPSLAYAHALTRGESPDPDGLDAVWHALLHDPSWQGVLRQYETLWRSRELMVHVDDLCAMARTVAEGATERGADPTTRPATARAAGWAAT